MKNLKLFKGVKKIFFLFCSICSIAVFISSCEKDDPEKKVWKRIIKAGKASISQSLTFEQYPAIENANVYVYGSSSDYLLKKNHISQGVTNSQGLFTFEEEFKKNVYPKVVWVWISKGNLNSYRYHSDGQSFKYDGKNFDAGENKILLQVSSTPTRLQLNILDNGVPVANAQVKLYFSEADYLAGKVYTGNEPEFNDLGLENSQNTLIGSSNTDGIVLFQNLEPRRYWFKVTYQSKTNTNTTNFLVDPLADNPDITTVRTVAIE